MTRNELIAEICKRTQHVDAAEVSEVIRALKEIINESTTKEFVSTLSALTE